ncbi:nime/cyclinb [Coprinopsis marcescibilis]|uniref:Nime/cyclinb n=1 Tax=Coprinopsis marcescibilis TaxID=230819 RepID=A0A5C3KPF2_COPMA|nr:nime/cyclinb [Coprinopsis marcescibilis]
MSSIPIMRRTTTRTTRTMKDSENASVRPTRTTMRVKAAGATATSIPATSRATAATAASKAKAIANDAEANGGKRKREALAEVTATVKSKKVAIGSLKGKETLAVAPTKPTVAPVQRVTRRTVAAAVPSAAGRDTKCSENTTTLKKKELKPASRVAITKVYSDEAPAADDMKGDEDEAEGSGRAFKKRQLEIAQTREEYLVQQPNESLEDAKTVADQLTAVEQESEAKIEPEPQLWDDLDADDWDDPLMVSEYVHDVCEYWKKTEVETLPKPDYMDLQTEITWEHRGILVDWLLQVHARFNLLPESLFLTVNLLDRFLEKRPISLNKLQLVGLACFFVASKFEETCAPSVNEIVFLADNQYSVAEVIKAEMYILKVLEWDLRCPGPMSWLRRGSKADDCETTARTVAKYLLEIACIERRLVGIVPSHIAAAALWLGRLAVGREDWTPTLERYTTFSEQKIIPVATIMLEYIITSPVQHESLYKKYTAKKYLKCSSYMRQWAFDRWPENSDIHLGRDLERIKEEIRVHRKELEEAAEEEAVRPAH